jgi:hypothetical protein
LIQQGGFVRWREQGLFVFGQASARGAAPIAGAFMEFSSTLKCVLL